MKITDEHLSNLNIKDGDILLLKHPKSITMTQFARIQSGLRAGTSKQVYLVLLPDDSDLVKTDIYGLVKIKSRIDKIIEERGQWK